MSCIYIFTDLNIDILETDTFTSISVKYKLLKTCMTITSVVTFSAFDSKTGDKCLTSLKISLDKTIIQTLWGINYGKIYKCIWKL